MASYESNELRLLQLPPQIRKKKSSGQQKKEELEREVGVLCKMLDHEQKVHEFLEQVQLQDKGSIIGIPNFIPPKVKELLAELAMVESEIAQLESQISHLQSDIKHEKEVTTQMKSKQNKEYLPQDDQNALLSFPTNGKDKKESKKKVAFETKTLHFISKAIKGDYNLSDFSISGKNLSSKAISFQKENEAESFRDKAKKSGILKPPSPMRDQRKPTPRRERNHDIPSDLPQKPIYVSPLQSEEENIQNLSPNKLSESIMKCLIFIYVRLLRTSRAIELEKSGPVSRSASFSLSFRAETSLNSKTTLSLHKDSRQSDPYGIFNMEDSIARDIGPYKNLVRFTSSSMDPKCISNSSSIPLFEKLKVLLNSLQKVDLTHMSYQQKLAFWINMYNASVMNAFLQYGVPTNCSPEALIALLNKATLHISGSTITAKGIECFILRTPESPLIKEAISNGDNKDSREAIARDRYKIEPSNPNVAFALCCGTRSSPAVKIYTPEGVISELEKSKLEYLQASIVVTSNTKRIAIPELLLQHRNDFAHDLESLIEWILQQLPTSGSLRKSLVGCFRSNAIVDRIPYEFEFQYLLAA